jgi:hypothetical protein
MYGRSYKEQVEAHRLTELGKRLYAPRKETVERSFADAKALHGQIPWAGQSPGVVLLPAACQDMKKIALLLARKACKSNQFQFLSEYGAY